MTDTTLTFTLDTGNDTGGDVVIKLRPDLAPGHVARITELAKDGFYDGVVFHRVINGFMAQGGDPTGTGGGGSDKPDIKAEFSAEPHVRGVCSMARTSAPNSANSQFFVCLDDARFLDNQYTVWGSVVEGMENAEGFNARARNHDQRSLVVLLDERRTDPIEPVCCVLAPQADHPIPGAFDPSRWRRLVLGRRCGARRGEREHQQRSRKTWQH